MPVRAFHALPAQVASVEGQGRKRTEQPFFVASMMIGAIAIALIIGIIPPNRWFGVSYAADFYEKACDRRNRLEGCAFAVQHNLFRGSKNVSSSTTHEFRTHASGAAALRFFITFGCQPFAIEIRTVVGSSGIEESGRLNAS